MADNKKINVGGQAVIEGVMMRSPDAVAIAVRRPDGKIALKKHDYKGFTKRYKFFNLPFIRGGVILIESMVWGIKALNFSSEIAMQEENSKKEKSKGSSSLMLAFTVLFAFAAGIGLFFFVPLLIAEATGVQSGVAFNLIDGAARLLIFLAYLGLISLWKEIKRIFEYHGAEHKSIFAYENALPLTVESAKPFKTFHPRCGTSFLLIVVIVSVVVFTFFGRPHTIADRLIRFLAIPVIGGISYEITRLSGSKYGKKLAGFLTAPGLWLQRITTKEPDDSQLETAIAALKCSLNIEQDDNPDIVVVE
ncbi:DUF1385 domain-containing protein [candidate division KSB1 bacterium]|nr:MAG: DUF1385 domain-containing protein [candidate division KSB1 bacterium]